MPPRQLPRVPTRSKKSRSGRVIRSAVLALATYAIGLIPFYFLTPVHEVTSGLFATSEAPLGASPAVVADAHPSKPSPAAGDVGKQIGADTAPVVDTTPPAATTPVAMPTPLPSDPRYAFLLLGYGGEGHDGAYLSDSMMVVVVDPDQKTLTLVSIPRDSWVPLLFDGRHAVYDKLNTAYAFAKDPSLFPERLDKYSGNGGAGTFAMETVSHLLGVPVRYYLGLDFAGFRQMINTVGGIDVNAPASFTARYPANDDASIDASWMTVHFAKGPQHLNGERAIEFARAREVVDNVDEASDFARSRRQRLIMEAFKTRLFQPGGLVHLPQLLPIAASHIDTNYAVPDVARLSALALDWQDVKIYQAALTTQNYLEEATGPEGAYVLVPSAPDHSWAQISALMRRLWKDPAAGAQIATTSVQVENDSGLPGAATRLSGALIKLGYHVVEPTSGPVRQTSRLVDRSPQGAPLVAQQLAADLGVQLDVAADLSSGTDNLIVLQLGADNPDLSPVIPPDDATAPLSLAGITKFGAWDPSTGEVAVTATRSPSPSAERSGTVTRTASPLAEPTPVPSLIASPTRAPLPTATPTLVRKRRAPTPTPLPQA